MAAVKSVYAKDESTGEETHYKSVKRAAEALGVSEKAVRNAIRHGYTCSGHKCRFGEPVINKHRIPKVNICFDCKKACGKCSWSAIDPVTGKVKFEPVPGWTAEKMEINFSWSNGRPCFSETYHITACPLFERDEPREANDRELTYTESKDFMSNLRHMLRRWEDG